MRSEGVGAINHLAASLVARGVSQHEICQSDDNVRVELLHGVDVLGSFELSEPNGGVDGDGVGGIGWGAFDRGLPTCAHDQEKIIGESDEFAQGRFIVCGGYGIDRRRMFLALSFYD